MKKSTSVQTPASVEVTAEVPLVEVFDVARVTGGAEVTGIATSSLGARILLRRLLDQGVKWTSNILVLRSKAIKCLCMVTCLVLVLVPTCRWARKPRISPDLQPTTGLPLLWVHRNYCPLQTESSHILISQHQTFDCFSSSLVRPHSQHSPSRVLQHNSGKLPFLFSMFLSLLSTSLTHIAAVHQNSQFVLHTNTSATCSVNSLKHKYEYHYTPMAVCLVK